MRILHFILAISFFISSCGQEKVVYQANLSDSKGEPEIIKDLDAELVIRNRVEEVGSRFEVTTPGKIERIEIQEKGLTIVLPGLLESDKQRRYYLYFADAKMRADYVEKLNFIRQRKLSGRVVLNRLTEDKIEFDGRLAQIEIVADEKAFTIIQSGEESQKRLKTAAEIEDKITKLRKAREQITKIEEEIASWDEAAMAQENLTVYMATLTIGSEILHGYFRRHAYKNLQGKWNPGMWATRLTSYAALGTMGVNHTIYIKYTAPGKKNAARELSQLRDYFFNLEMELRELQRASVDSGLVGR